MNLLGESIPIRLFLAGYDLTATMRDVNKKFSVRYFLNLVLVDEEDRRYFKQQVKFTSSVVTPIKGFQSSKSFFVSSSKPRQLVMYYNLQLIDLNSLVEERNVFM